MASESSFDAVSKPNMAELENAINQTLKELATRFDFRGVPFKVDLDQKAKELKLESDSEGRAGHMPVEPIEVRRHDDVRFELRQSGTEDPIQKIKEKRDFFDRFQKAHDALGHQVPQPTVGDFLEGEALEGQSEVHARTLIKAFKTMMLENAPVSALPEELEALSALEGVRKFPLRVKCATLAWNTIAQGLDAAPQEH
jgi:hypothetical protein